MLERLKEQVDRETFLWVLASWRMRGSLNGNRMAVVKDAQG